MAKKGKSSPSKGAAVGTTANLDAESAKRLAELKTDGNNSFAKGDYNKALKVYDEAIKLLPAGAAEKAEFYNNKAACFIGLKRFKDAVKECSSALEVSPGSFKALQRRAKALEQQGLYKDALADIAAIHAAGGATDETREAERRLNSSLSSSSGAGSGARTQPAGANAAAAAQQHLFQAKVSLGDETKLLHLSAVSSYGDVLAAAKAKFPNAGPFVLKYVDKEGDLVTLTCREDLHTALHGVIEQYQRQVAAANTGRGPKLPAALTIPPPLRLHAIPVASEAEVPKPPATEDPLGQHQQLAGRPAQGATEEVQLENWMLDFASLFMQFTGLEPDKHVELHNLGWDAVTRALDSTIQSEQAEPLFKKAADSFRDIACTGLNNWGTVHQMLGTRLVDSALRAGKTVADVEAAAMKEFDAAERRFKEALDYNSDFFDSVCCMAQLEFERCKIKAGFGVPGDAGAKGEAQQQQQQQQEGQAAAPDAAAAAQREALSKLDAAKVKASAPWLDRALMWADKAINLAPGLDKKREEGQLSAVQVQKQADGSDFTFKAQALVLKGNFLFEWSQLQSAVDAEWKASLDKATQLFRDASCPERDIVAALRNHVRASELNLPEPEPEEQPQQPAAKAEGAAKAAAAAPSKPAPEAAKGLPSLEVKKKKGSAAPAAPAAAADAAPAASS